MHTQEPWTMQCEEDETDWPRYWPTIHAGETEIVGTEGFYGESREQSIEDARRVVACVNACIGVPTETLERWARSEGFQGVTMNTHNKD